ncbi:MAG: HutD family protein [Deltaproteobacteria bacterium]|nr:HutD family protein [Deltaproteobacteria bacterium]MBK8716993.1 HutD family protein [Deltaproteobacteria bacterium]
MQLLRAHEATQVPWKNGLGVTTELAVWPRGSSFDRDDFRWRLSAAAVEADGPFSRFDGCDRVLVVTAGAGLVLDHGGAAPAATIGRLQPHAFAGEWTTTAQLVDGAVVDFNLIHRRDVPAELAVFAGDDRPVEEDLAHAHVFVHLLRGSVGLSLAGATAQLDAGDSAWMQGARGSQRLRLCPRDAEWLIVRIG